jgi:hypothetical protein
LDGWWPPDRWPEWVYSLLMAVAVVLFVAGVILMAKGIG